MITFRIIWVLLHVRCYLNLQTWCVTFFRQLNKNIKKNCKNKKRKRKWYVTHRACAHNTLVALLRWEEVVLVEGLPWLINSSIIPAGFHWSSQPCRDPGLIIWGGQRSQGESSLSKASELTRCLEEEEEEEGLPVHLGQHCWGSATGFSHGRAGHLIVLHFTWPV